MMITISGRYSRRASGVTIRWPVPATYIPCLRGLMSTTRSIGAPGPRAFRNVTPLEPTPQTTTRREDAARSAMRSRHVASRPA